MMPTHTILVTGATGQDGRLLIQDLLARFADVSIVALRRPSSTFTPPAISNVEWVEIDLLDRTSLAELIRARQFDSIFNLAAQTHVGKSFSLPCFTNEVNHVSVVAMLDAIKRWSPATRFYQASTSEMFGNSPAPQDEQTPFKPLSPYAVAKVAAHHACQHYRDAYNLHVSCGILFNHESPIRGREFVTRKITMGLANMVKDSTAKLTLGNMDARRDWGWASEYVRVMQLILEHDRPGDWVVATGRSISVQQFLDAAIAAIPDSFDLKQSVYDRITIDAEAFKRPSDVPELCGDAYKARRELGWIPGIVGEGVAEAMMLAELGIEQ